MSTYSDIKSDGGMDPRNHLTEQQAYDMGAKGAEPTEEERLLFEAWMRGHCWEVEGGWDGKTYVHSTEINLRQVHFGAMRTRRLWAAWRDRAALAAPVQDVDWKDMYEKEKRRSEMWIAKYEKDIGPLEKAVPVAAPVQEPVGRTDQQIVEQTEELAVWLLSWRFNHQPETDTPMRESTHPFAERCWAAACHIQEMLTATDPENAVAELDVNDTPPAAQRPWVGLTANQRNDCIKFPQRNLIARDGTTSQRIAQAIEAKLKELNT